MHTCCQNRTDRIIGAIARALALVAMVVQVLFFADHIGAMAAKTTGSSAFDARLGFMELCTGNGIKVVALDGSPLAPGHDCPICESASVMAFGTPTEMPAAEFPVSVFAASWDLARGTDAAETAFPGHRPIRAPPVAFS